MAKDYDKEDGVWRTVGGRRIFIRNGQDLASAMKESGKFKSAKKQETEEEKGKKLNETMDKRAAIINKLDEDTRDLEDYDKYNLAISKLEQTEDMQPTERQYWVGVKERYEKQEKARDHTFKMNDEEKKKYEEVGKKIDNLTKEIDEAKEEKPSEAQYTDIEQEALDRFTEDYGWEDNDSLKNLREQIDSMRNPGDSIHRTAERLVEGGDYLIYNGDIQEWLDKHGIEYNEDNFFDKYKKTMADSIEKLYNGKEEKTTNGTMNNMLQQKAYQKYLKEHPNSEMKFEDFIKNKK